jgi:hypothetical protein
MRTEWCGEEKERDISCFPCRKWEQKLKIMVPNSWFYAEEQGGERRNTHGQR